MREYPIEKFWYGKGAAYKDIFELIEKNPKWFIWAVESFQDVTEAQAEHFKKLWGMELPESVICPNIILEAVLGGKVYEHKKGDTDETYIELCKIYNQKRAELSV